MNFWDKIFKNGAIWEHKPSLSSVIAANYFSTTNQKNILIPGIGYGRNAPPFIKKGFAVTGIEISINAIKTARDLDFNFPIHHGSVLHMPFDNNYYNGIYCYAVLHLFNKMERTNFLQSCYNQLAHNGVMVFVVVSTKSNLYGKGKLISNNRFKIDNGLSVYFYDNDSIEKEFQNFGLEEYMEIDEPIQHLKDEPPIKCYYVICKK